MEVINVKTQLSEYPIYIKESFSDLEKAFDDAGLRGRKAVIITDTNVEKIYLDEVKKILENITDNICVCVFEAGEKSKSLDTISEFYKTMLTNKLDRKSFVAALGGGVVGDMAGFAAATYMRGIPFVQIPTTLLSQVDSSVGGKTGVDFMGSKNIIGAFYQPEFVYINSSTLKTLPEREVSGGMAEVIKYGYIIDKDYLDMLEKRKAEIKSLEHNALEEVIYGSCKSKAYVVSKDEKENGLRAILNFGHTFGHAIESLSGFSLIHGECVAIGMAAALEMSRKRGNITQNDVERGIELMKYFKLPAKAYGFETDDVYKQMFYDKKTKNNNLDVIVLEKIGKAYIESNASEQEIKDAIKFVLQKDKE